MLKRTITSAFLVACACILLYFSYIPEVITCACAIIAAFSVYEICRAAGYSGNEAFLTVSILAAVALSLWDIPYYEKILSFLLPVAALGFVLLMLFQKRISLRNPVKAMLLNLTVAALYQSFHVLRGMEYGLYYLAGAIIVCAVTDVAAYLVGRTLGRHKLIPAVSPNKTVEGSLAGLVFAVLIMLLLGTCLGLAGLIRVDYPKLVLYSVLASAIGQFGDLTMSAVKRVCGIKDFGNIFPGHGGMLDRLDSHLFAVPFTLLYCCMAGGFIL